MPKKFRIEENIDEMIILDEVLEKVEKEQVIIQCENYNDASSLRAKLLRFIDGYRSQSFDAEFARKYPSVVEASLKYNNLKINQQGPILIIKKGSRYQILDVPSSPPQAIE